MYKRIGSILHLGTELYLLIGVYLPSEEKENLIKVKCSLPHKQQN
jgi:hypothetical protein